MRYRPLATILILASLFVEFANAQSVKQVAPVPGDQFELVTGPAIIAETPEKRSTILALLERARQNNSLHINGTRPFALKVTFSANGASAYAGAGDLEEDWISNSVWKWTSHLGTYSQSRIFHDGVAFDSNPHAYLPMRLQMIRQAIFWPVSGNFSNDMIRFAEATWNGKHVTCALIAGPRAEANSQSGRQWNEEEFCIDSVSGLLQTYSTAPGIYTVYDYSNALQFHGRTLARHITIVENATTAAEVQLNDIQDLNSTDPNLFLPGPELQGPGVMIGAPMRFPQIVKKDSALGGVAVVQPVIIHAALDTTGKVLEAEALQSPESLLSQAAIRLVKNTNYGPTRGAVPLQRDVFINVQFGSSQ